MLKIEVIKFEAQDIITTSGTPAAPKDETNTDCKCISGYCMIGSMISDMKHFLHIGCNASSHDCGNPEECT